MRHLFSLFAFSALACAQSQVDWIWSARYVVTMDAQRRVIENGAIAISGDQHCGRRHAG